MRRTIDDLAFACYTHHQVICGKVPSPLDVSFHSMVTFVPGEVLYHAHVAKSARQLAQQRRSLPTLKKNKKTREKNEEYRVIRRLRDRQEREQFLEKQQKEELKQAKEEEGGENEEREGDRKRPAKEGRTGIARKKARKSTN